MSATEPLTTAVQARAPDAQDRSERGQARRERWRLLRRRPGFIFGVVVLVFWVFCAIGASAIAPYGAKQTGLRRRSRRAATTCSAPTRSDAMCSRV